MLMKWEVAGHRWLRLAEAPRREGRSLAFVSSAAARTATISGGRDTGENNARLA
jgi:hypothetical protein